MTKLAEAIRIALLVLALGAIAACSPTYRFHGYAPDDARLEQIEVGTDTRESVAEKIGRPGASGLLRDGAWYYVQSDWRHAGWRSPEEIDRQVVAISFDGGGTVANVERFGLEDGQVVALSRRVTERQTSGITFLQQLFGNIGNFRADQFVE